MYKPLRDQLERCQTRQTHEGDEDNEDEDNEDESMDVDESEEDVAQKNKIVSSIG
jgi:hypothetical protein